MQGMAESDEDEHVDDFLHGRRLRIGIISPYAFETPGGVQSHIRDFANELICRGHDVQVFAPGRRTKDMPLWVFVIRRSIQRFRSAPELFPHRRTADATLDSPRSFRSAASA